MTIILIQLLLLLLLLLDQSPMLIQQRQLCWLLWSVDAFWRMKRDSDLKRRGIIFFLEEEKEADFGCLTNRESRTFKAFLCNHVAQ